MKQRRNKIFLQAFGFHLKALRKKRGYSQEKLAYESELELRQIGRIERGEINTGLSSIALIAETLNVEVNELFDFEY